MINKSKVSAFRITKPEAQVLVDVHSGFGQPIDTIVSVNGDKKIQEFGNLEAKPIDSGAALKNQQIVVHVMCQDKNTSTDNLDVAIKVYEEGGTSVSMNYKGEASEEGEMLVMDLTLFCI
ncbi:MAG: hypothetical protein RLP14_05550 [Owenweeksia sp.]